MSISILNPIKHFTIIFKAEFIRLIAYRAQFWFELILSSIIELSIGIILWKAIFASANQEIIKGYTLPGMLVYVTVATFFTQAIKGSGIGTFQREIYKGTFTKFLIYPLSIFSYKLGTFMPRSFFAVVQLFIALFFIFQFYSLPAELNISVASFCLGLISLTLAVSMYFFALFIIEIAAFWVDNVWALAFSLQIIIAFFGGQALPIVFFPEFVQKILYLSPFPYFIYIPTQIFLGKYNFLQIQEFLVLQLFWLSILVLICKLYLKQGLKNYAGVGQ